MHDQAGLDDAVVVTGRREQLQLSVRAASLPRGSPIAQACRLVHITALAARYLAPEALGRLARRGGNPARAARNVFEHLGATYIKFGQFVASAPGIVGEGVAQEFRRCLDTGPAVPFRLVRAVIESELGRPLEQAFLTFQETPLAAASIAVVHTATLRDGTPVAVKVLRPGIERTVATDLAILERIARLMAGRGIDQAYNMVGLIVGLRMQIAEELDLRNEARTMDVFRELYERYELSLLVVPRAYHDLTARRVLTMQLLDGAPLDDLAHARSLGVDPAPLVRELLNAWILTGLRVGAFHADIHAGNLLLLRDGRLGMIDWGIVAQMEGSSRRMFRSLCRAAIGDEAAWEDIGTLMIEVNGASLYALGLTDDQIHRFARAIFEPVLTHPLRDVSMADLMMNGDDVVRKATGESPPRRSLRDRLNIMRAAARAYRSAAANGVFESPTMRMGFLSMKQLVYLERYGRMYIPEEALLGDTDFVRRALEGAPA
jgi:predicted unusual protein kinase regulating ubiquinone biosynthesis (AarF/ABC1/UbiB family)